MQQINEVKNAIRSPFAWPGGYPVYTVMSDGEMLCCKCAKNNFKAIVAATKAGLRDGWKAEGAQILWEGEEYCAHCGSILESAYGSTEEDA